MTLVDVVILEMMEALLWPSPSLFNSQFSILLIMNFWMPVKIKYTYSMFTLEFRNEQRDSCENWFLFSLSFSIFRLSDLRRDSCSRLLQDFIDFLRFWNTKITSEKTMGSVRRIRDSAKPERFDIKYMILRSFWFGKYLRTEMSNMCFSAPGSFGLYIVMLGTKWIRYTT